MSVGRGKWPAHHVQGPRKKRKERKRNDRCASIPTIRISYINVYVYVVETDRGELEREMAGMMGPVQSRKESAGLERRHGKWCESQLHLTQKKEERRASPLYKSSIQFLATNSKILEIELVRASSCLIRRDTTFSNLFFPFLPFWCVSVCFLGQVKEILFY